MTLDQLEMIEAVVEEGSMQKAAKKLHKSQPSLSVGIKKVEETYGIEIFSRKSYRPTLTAAGKRFYKGVSNVLESQRRLKRLAQELTEGIETEIRIVIDPLVSIQTLSPLLKAALPFRETTQLILTESVLEGPVQSILEERTHFAIGYCTPEQAKRLEIKPLHKVELISAIQKDLTSSQVPNIVATNIQEGESNFVSLEHSWSVSSHLRKEELILEGLGWGGVSKEVFNQNRSKLKMLRTKGQTFELPIFLMKNKHLTLGKVAHAIWNA